MVQLLLALGACHPTTSTFTDGDADADADADSDADTDTDTYGYGHSWTTTWGHSDVLPVHSAVPFEVDCNAVTNQPLSFRTVNGARGYHDVAIAPTGHILGQDSAGNLVRALYMQNPTVFVPNTGTLQGMDWLPNGDLAIARDRDRTITRVTQQGATTVISNNVGAYGVITGPDGQLYVANYDQILRIDPTTGAKTVLLQPPAQLQPRVINFSPDYSRMYIGTIFGNGNIFYVDLNPDLTVASNVRVFATGVGTGSYHDCLQVDYCGNLYVSDFSTRTLYKIDPNGNTRVYLEMVVNNQYGHGARFGNGVGGFRLDALYMPQPYHANTVAEIVLGVPSRTWDGTPF
ncbi:MAG: hypothetical protein KC621_23560 [Myxococcales bacterium]|nr:hypothetical protein [Myxococcales bacterium]